MKVFIVFILATVILQSNGSMEDSERREDLLSAPKGMTRQSLWQQLNTVVTESLRVYQTGATEEDRQAVDAVLPHGDTSLIQTFEESSTTSATTPENASKAKPGKKKRTEEDSDSEEETGPDAKRKPLSGEIYISYEMKTVLGELAETLGRKITLDEAKKKLLEVDSSLDEDLQDHNSKLSNSLRGYLRTHKLLQTVRIQEKRITDEMKTALRELAEAQGGEITLAAARKKLIELDPSLDQNLQNSRSTISKALRHYLSHHKLLESVPLEERITDEMKTALGELAKAQGGEITLSAAREKITELNLIPTQDEDSRSKIFAAIRHYLTRHNLLETVRIQEKKFTEEMKTALREFAKAHRGKITLAAARKKLIELDPSLDQNLQPRSKLSEALRHYLSHHKLLETVRKTSKAVTIE